MADKVRDRRERNWSWFHNEVLQVHGVALGPYGIAVYMALLTFADAKDHTCYPSLQQIADMTGMSRRHVMRSLELLQRLKLIRKTYRHEQGKRHASNLYTILQPDSDYQSPRSDSESPRGDYQSPTLVTTSHHDGDYQSPEPDSYNQTQLNQRDRVKTRPVDNSGQPVDNVLTPGDARASPPSLRPEDLVKGWNDICASEGLPKKLKLTDALRQKIRLRLRRFPDEAFWEEVFNRIWKTPFLRGNNARGWMATFDWLMANDQNAVKVYEGHYGKTDR
ncbi:MAG TPA: helix-turn-helix domain-containing protein [Alphaproteobacteria bacterium]|nr:helix-turn-helix domain-containing protein [Alphaproteobacteria bacterium]